MLCYLICFSISVFFENIALKNEKNHLRFWLFTIMSIFTAVILAGCRDYNIGSDVNGYRNFHWILACQSKNMVTLINRLDTEILFSVLIYVVSRFTEDFHFVLAICQLIITSCIFYGSWQYRKFISPAWIIAIYYLLFFNESLNIIRQHIAMAIVFAGFSYIEKSKYRIYLIFVLIAFLFHNSAIMAIIPLLFQICLYDKNGSLKENAFIRKLVISLSIMLSLICIKYIYNFLLSINLLRSAYSYYFDVQVTISSNTMIMLLAIEISILFLNKKKYSKGDTYYDFYELNTCVCFIMFLFSKHIFLSSRLTNYLWLFNIISYVRLIIYSQKGKSKLVVNTITVLICLYYWYYMYIQNVSGNTYPYTSEILSNTFG